MMLRRLKEDVEKNLAPKEETIIEVGPRSLLELSNLNHCCVSEKLIESTLVVVVVVRWS